MSTPQPPIPYVVPSCLRDLVMIDLLELTGSTIATARELGMSQSSVSRRYRAVANELGLEANRQGPAGRRYGSSTWLQLLRQGINSHRHACGVLRVGGAGIQPPSHPGWQGVEWVPLHRRTMEHWEELLGLELLDAVVVPQATAAAAKADGRWLLKPVQPALAGDSALICRIGPGVHEALAAQRWLEAAEA